MKLEGILIGADPEVFLMKGEKPVSAIGTIKGTKEHPYKISEDGHSIQVDNVLLEFNVPAVNTPEMMHKNIEFVFNWLKKYYSSEYAFGVFSSFEMDSKELQHPDANRFGCDPDFSVWTENVNAAPLACGMNLRSAGGHIHVSYDGATIDNSLELLKLFDLYLGIPSMFRDTDTKRRLLYGKAGAFRFKNYPGGASGFEYRTLSNFWIKDEENVSFIFHQIEKAFNAFKEGFTIDRTGKLARDIIRAINTNDLSVAKKLIRTYNI